MNIVALQALLVTSTVSLLLHANDIALVATAGAAQFLRAKNLEELLASNVVQGGLPFSSLPRQLYVDVIADFAALYSGVLSPAFRLSQVAYSFFCLACDLHCMGLMVRSPRLKSMARNALVLVTVVLFLLWNVDNVVTGVRGFGLFLAWVSAVASLAQLYTAGLQDKDRVHPRRIPWVEKLLAFVSAVIFLSIVPSLYPISETEPHTAHSAEVAVFLHSGRGIVWTNVCRYVAAFETVVFEALVLARPWKTHSSYAV